MGEEASSFASVAALPDVGDGNDSSSFTGVGSSFLSGTGLAALSSNFDDSSAAGATLDHDVNRGLPRFKAKY